MALRRARTLALLSIVLAGCSGAESSDLFAGTSEQTDTSATEPVPSATTPSTPNDVPDASAPVPVPSNDAGVDAAPPAPKCTPEAEPNNTINNATTFTASLCGKIASNADVDFGRFVVPAGATSLSIKHAENGGKVTYRYYLNGQLLPATGDAIRAIPGAVYSVQIKLSPTSDGGDRPTYELEVAFN